MNWKLVDGVLKVKLLGSFNIIRVRKLESVIRDVDNVNCLEIDLSESRFVDTEAIAFMYRYKMRGGKLVLKHAPEIFSEVLKILQVSV